MRELLLGPVAEALGLVLYVAIAGTLTVVGALAERAGLSNLTAGQTTLGLWEAALGAVLLYAALNVAYHIVFPRLRGAEPTA
ncbi:hypothetical protein C475_16446 [Halosimplex carlsbadense 2-9-1]|uniref:DUF8151 domain-containing protein n=1 Tax=Halosimplex carlsbadense 2-9-1 TaxID=797114 RepID=M0CLE8_9EURY|nr:hypothetical protein [Halosimplex carlsbadense]ELZ22709.1 hypothetical protein C475_16446 [Halosimplex carlsbadense 2-9-1]